MQHIATLILNGETKPIFENQIEKCLPKGLFRLEILANKSLISHHYRGYSICLCNIDDAQKYIVKCLPIGNIISDAEAIHNIKEFTKVIIPNYNSKYDSCIYIDISTIEE